jgi:hypothetical protein
MLSYAINRFTVPSSRFPCFSSKHSSSLEQRRITRCTILQQQLLLLLPLLLQVPTPFAPRSRFDRGLQRLQFVSLGVQRTNELTV